MNVTREWPIVFFETLRGERPVQLFIQSLDEDTESKVFRNLKLLRQYGPLLSMPYAKKIAPKLYELRVGGQTQIRVFYTIHNNQAYLLHAFLKKSQKLPIKELELAKNRLRQIN